MLIQKEWSHRSKRCLIFHVRSAFEWVVVLVWSSFSLRHFFFVSTLKPELLSDISQTWNKCWNGSPSSCWQNPPVRTFIYIWKTERFDTQKWTWWFSPLRLWILRPVACPNDPFKALVFDSSFDHYRGVVTNVALFGGQVKKGDRIVSAHLGKTYEVNELGLLRPDEHPTQKLWVSIYCLWCGSYQ